MEPLRTAKTDKAYKDLIATGALAHFCALCDAPALVDFQQWKIISNNFPYDAIAALHHMIVPKRHVTEVELSDEEIEELAQIRIDYIHPTYSYIMEATHKKKSIKGHYHLHLLTLIEKADSAA